LEYKIKIKQKLLPKLQKSKNKNIFGTYHSSILNISINKITKNMLLKYTQFLILMQKLLQCYSKPNKE